MLALLPAIALSQTQAPESRPELQRPPDLQPLSESPDLPGQVQSGETLEPEVVIVRRDKSTITEYRVNGQLRAIKVQPDGDFPPYYLYDTDGDGRLDRRDSRFVENLLIPSWVIFSW